MQLMFDAQKFERLSDALYSLGQTTEVLFAFARDGNSPNVDVFSLVSLFHRHNSDLWTIFEEMTDELPGVSLDKSTSLTCRLVGEGPRSGEGDTLSGAGAKRKEGVQPPADNQTEGD